MVLIRGGLTDRLVELFFFCAAGFELFQVLATFTMNAERTRSDGHGDPNDGYRKGGQVNRIACNVDSVDFLYRNSSEDHVKTE
jgi:hypothetical protein